MPKYRYRCDCCEGTFLLVQKINDEPETKCFLKIPLGSDDGVRCNGSVRRIPSAGGFVLNGKGWYRDGY